MTAGGVAPNIMSYLFPAMTERRCDKQLYAAFSSASQPAGCVASFPEKKKGYEGKVKFKVPLIVSIQTVNIVSPCGVIHPTTLQGIVP